MVGDTDHNELVKGDIMSEKPTYEELEQRVRELEQMESEYKRAEEAVEHARVEREMILDSQLEHVRLSSQFGNTKFGNYIVNIKPRCSNTPTTPYLRNNTRYLAATCCGVHSNDRFPAWR